MKSFNEIKEYSLNILKRVARNRKQANINKLIAFILKNKSKINFKMNCSLPSFQNKLKFEELEDEEGVRNIVSLTSYETTKNIPAYESKELLSYRKKIQFWNKYCGSEAIKY